MLPPNGTHYSNHLKCLFGLMKAKWRTELDNWRKESCIRVVLPKGNFPMLLKRFANACSGTIGKTLISGFQTCRLYQLDCNQVLVKLPQSLDVSRLEASMNVMLIHLLEENRNVNKGKRQSMEK